MFDINAIISQALAPAVAQATAPLLERIAALEAQSADRHARLRVLEGALTDRVAALENQALVVSDAVDKRIAALEKRVFEDLGTIIEQEFIASMAVTDVVGHDTVKALTDRVAALETKLTEADLFTKTTEVHINKDELLEYLDNQEWFWDKIRNFTDTAVEQAVENHTDMYDHNDFVTEDKLDDYVKTEDLDSEVRDAVRDAVRDIMEGATVSIRI